MLLIGDRVVLRANAPPEAEYILFEIGDIELRSSEPGRVREHGYQTTVERARARLAQAGATAALARECATAMQPVLSAAYARGPAAKHVARYLGPLELFQADHYDAGAHVYRGVFLELPAIVADLDMPPAAVAMQALYLAMLLEHEADETTVFLSTDAWTKQRKPGERTHRRPNASALRDIRSALGELASLDPRPAIREQLPRQDVIAFVRARAESAPDHDARALFESLERAIAVRDMPDRGPLSEAELWAIEIRLDTGDREGILEAVENVERSRGRTPGTTYLRARASLALRLEPPKLIAERVSALALSMTSFQELGLLAAEAWLEAGDPRRAMPYARDLVDSPGVDEGLLLRAKRLLARTVSAAPEKPHQTFADSIPAAAMAPSQRPGAMGQKGTQASLPPVSVPDPDGHSAFAFTPAKSRVPTDRKDQPPPRRPPTAPGLGAVVPAVNKRGNVATERDPDGRSPRPTAGSAPPLPPPSLSAPPPPDLSAPLTSQPAPPLPSQRAPSPRPPPLPRRKAQSAEVMPSAPPPPLELDLPPPADMSASFTFDLPGPEALPPVSSMPPSDAPEESERPATSQAPPRRRRSMGVVQMESRAPPGFDPRAEPDGNDAPSPSISGGPHSSTARGDAASKETLRGKDLEEARRNGRHSFVPPPPGLPRDDTHGRPTPLRPPPSSPVPLPPRSGRNAQPSRQPPPDARQPSSPPPPMRAPMATPVLDADLPPSSTEEVARTLEREKSIRRNSASNLGRTASPLEQAMHGASLPPYRLENPPPLLPKAPLMPKLGGSADELAEHLALPAGLGSDGRALDTLPKSVLEARIAFTVLAREVGLDYRLKRGIELRADVSGLEAMQSVLLESFPDHAIRTAEDAYELRRHGALLSEILARRLDAEWIDISPNELGYWAMIVPPDTRVWPFGRVARLVEMGHKERDLVSYFLELQSRARGR
jgi:hypothetical protein